MHWCACSRRDVYKRQGVDEAGRGPLCGPVCVAACILDPENPVYGINDSKKLTEKKMCIRDRG